MHELKQKMDIKEFLMWSKYTELYGSPNPSKNIAIYGARVASTMGGVKAIDLLPKGFNPDRDVEVTSDNVDHVAATLGLMGGGTTRTLTKARRKTD